MGSSQKAEIEMVAIKIELGEGFEERFSGLSRTRSSHCLNALKARKVSSSSRAGRRVFNRCPGFLHPGPVCFYSCPWCFVVEAKQKAEVSIINPGLLSEEAVLLGVWEC